ncbi:MAG TPA: dienelactone hydrolase family protein [Casimicrobiaceae bacterium]
MGQMIRLTAADGQVLGAYEALPEGPARGGIVVVQEIFGVNGHIRGVADGYARDGYRVVAPALFDRVRPGIELGYTDADVAQGRAIRDQVTFDNALADVAAAQAALRDAGNVGIVGYCWGGTVTWLAAARLAGFAAASSYYGGGIGKFAAQRPRCPTRCHFGEKDHAIPLDEVDALRNANPAVEVFLYPAGHGFNCDARASYDAASAKLARERTLAFFRTHVG